MSNIFLKFVNMSIAERVKHVLNYKKPTLWIVVLALLSCAVTAACFLTNPKDQTVSDLLDRICSSPGISSYSGDYIEAHPEEYNALLSNRESTLRYCIAEFMKGNQTDLRGHIMASACEELLQFKDDPLFDNITYSTGQEWFDAILAHAPNMIEPYLSPADHEYVFGE